MRRFVLGLALILVVASGMWLALWDRSPGDGPLLDGGLGFVQSQPLNVGEPYSWGSVLLRVDGNKPAIVERVRLLGVTGGLKLLQIHSRPIPDERGQGLFLGGAGFPSIEYPSKPLAEQKVVPVGKTLTPAGTPEQGLQIILGLEVNDPGVARWREVEVTYKVGNHRYRETYKDEVYLCAPMAEYVEVRKKCPPPEVEGKFGEGVLG